MCIHIYIYIYIFLSLSLYTYIYIYICDIEGDLRGPKEGGLNIGQQERLNKCKELRVKRDRTGCDLRPPFLGTPLVPF